MLCDTLMPCHAALFPRMFQRLCGEPGETKGWSFFMTKHQKKMVAPIIVTCLLSAYLLAYVYVAVTVPMTVILKVLIGLASAALFGTSIYVLIQRIKEIRSSEEDDLSQY